MCIGDEWSGGREVLHKWSPEEEKRVWNEGGEMREKKNKER